MTITVDLAMTLVDGTADVPEDDSVLVAGPPAAAQEVARRWILTPGDLWEDEAAGAGLLAYQGEGLTPRGRTALEARLLAEALAVPRVAAASATLDLDAGRQALAARGDLDTDDGPVDLLVPLDATSTAIVLGT